MRYAAAAFTFKVINDTVSFSKFSDLLAFSFQKLSQTFPKRMKFVCILEMIYSRRDGSNAQIKILVPNVIPITGLVEEKN